MKVCPECLCNKFYYDYYKSETSCRHCGLVLEAPYEHGIVHQGFKFVSHRKRCYSIKVYGKVYNVTFVL